MRPDASLRLPEPRAVVRAADRTDRDQFLLLRARFGLVPRLFRAQGLLPHLVGPQLRITEAVQLRDGALSGRLKELIGLAIAADRRNRYATAMHWSALRGLAGHDMGREVAAPGAIGLSTPDRAVLHFAVRVGRMTSSIGGADFASLRGAGLTDLHVVEAVAVAALAVFECTVAAGLRIGPDFDVPDMASLEPLVNVEAPPAATSADDRTLSAARGPDVERTAPMPFLKEAFGLVPNLFRILMTRPDLAEAVASALSQVLLSDMALSRTQKQNIFLVVSAAKRNTYCVAAHCEMLRSLGMSVELADQIAVDHRYADLSDGDKALLDAALELSVQPGRFGSGGRRRLREHGFHERQILEAVAMSGFAEFLNALSIGLAAEPDFAAPPVFAAKAATEPAPVAAALNIDGGPAAPPDPDWTSVSRVQRGEIDAFEDLVRRHGRRVRATLAGILRNEHDVEDAVQDTFVKAFRHIGGFHGRSKFSTWVTRIAINTALQRLRARRRTEGVGDTFDSVESARPRQLQTWQQDPEAAYSRAAIRELVLKAVRGLPLKYRVVVVLRDLQQLSTAETAEALHLGVPGVKTRLLRGRLMLREALAPYFARKEDGSRS